MLDDYTVEFQHLDDMHYGSIHTYVKVEEKCWNTLCNEKKSSYHLPCQCGSVQNVWILWTISLANLLYCMDTLEERVLI